MDELSEVLTDLYSLKSALASAAGRLARHHHLTTGLHVQTAAEMAATGVREIQTAIKQLEADLAKARNAQPSFFP